MSYRFLGQNRSLRGYGGSLPVVVHCLYDTTGQAVQSLYYRDPSRYGGSGNNVCYKDNTFSEPPRVRPPTQSVLTCVKDLYGRTIYDIYGMSVCYVPKVAAAPSIVAVPTETTPVTTAAPSTTVDTTPSMITASTVSADVPTSTLPSPQSLYQGGAESQAITPTAVPSAAVMTPEQKAWEVQDMMDDLQRAADRGDLNAAATLDALRKANNTEEPKDNKAVIIGGIALLAVIGGVVYYKMRKG